MKGLLLKDILIIRNQGKSLLLIFFMGIMMSLTMQISSVIAYLTLLGGMLAMGTLSYDEADRGYSFLFTLPASRKTYVKEKYLFCLLFTALCLLAGILSCLLLSLVKDGASSISLDEIISTSCGMFFSVLLFLIVEIPLRLKYGLEKSRISLYIFAGVIALIALLFTRILPEAVIDQIDFWFIHHVAIVGLTLIALILIGLYVSYRISIRILLKKEF